MKKLADMIAALAARLNDSDLTRRAPRSILMRPVLTHRIAVLALRRR